jgi:hypothetical protein
MSHFKLPLEGSCRCGQVRIRISAPPILTMACHCTGCQRMTGSAYSLNAAVPTPGFEVVSGSPVLGGLRNPELQHHFCPQCMSWIYSQFRPDFVNVRVTMLDDTTWFVPFIETWTEEKLPWATTPAVHSYPGFPPMERYGELMAEFATTLAKR